MREWDPMVKWSGGERESQKGTEYEISEPWEIYAKKKNQNGSKQKGGERAEMGAGDRGHAVGRYGGAQK